MGRHPGAILARCPGWFANRESQCESLRRQLYRSRRQNFVEGDTPPRRPAVGRGVPQPSNHSRDQQRGYPEQGRRRRSGGRAEGFSDRFLRDSFWIADFSLFGTSSGPDAEHFAGKLSIGDFAPDAGTGRKAGVKTEHDLADRGDYRRRERARQERFASGTSAASQSQRWRAVATTEFGGRIRRWRNSWPTSGYRFPWTHWAVLSVFGWRGVRRANFRFESVSPLPSFEEHRERQQAGQSIDP